MNNQTVLHPRLVNALLAEPEERSVKLTFAKDSLNANFDRWRQQIDRQIQMANQFEATLENGTEQEKNAVIGFLEALKKNVGDNDNG